jgi:hypothetical protein
MDAAGAVDAQTASTAPWKTAQTAVSHSAHTHHRLVGEGRRVLTVTASHTKFRTPPSAPAARSATDARFDSHAINITTAIASSAIAPITIATLILDPSRQIVLERELLSSVKLALRSSAKPRTQCSPTAADTQKLLLLADLAKEAARLRIVAVRSSSREQSLGLARPTMTTVEQRNSEVIPRFLLTVLCCRVFPAYRLPVRPNRRKRIAPCADTVLETIADL